VAKPCSRLNHPEMFCTHAVRLADRADVSRCFLPVAALVSRPDIVIAVVLGKLPGYDMFKIPSFTNLDQEGA